MHEWDAETDLFAHSVIGYAIERLRLPKDPVWGAHPADELNEALAGAICAHGVGGHEALRLFRDVLMPACRPMEHPMNLAYVPTAPSIAATMFDLVVSASSIFAGNWESGAGAIAAENQALRWLADLAGFPPESGGVFLSGGSAANLSALVAARQRFRQRYEQVLPLAIVTTAEAHASVRAAARVMDVEVLTVPCDTAGRMTAGALGVALDAATSVQPFAVVASAGTTNAGAIDDLDGIGALCADRDLWLHVDGAYGLAALCSTIARSRLAGIERADSFGVDPHKWLFVPYDCAALVYKDPGPAAETHAQHGAYLDTVDRQEWNPADYAYHLSRRARGLPLWFALATYGTEAFSQAVDTTLQVAASFAAAVDADARFELLCQPQLSVVLFARHGWEAADYLRWSRDRARRGVALVVPTTWNGMTCLRVCVVNPQTTAAALAGLLDDIGTCE